MAASLVHDMVRKGYSFFRTSKGLPRYNMLICFRIFKQFKQTLVRGKTAFSNPDSQICSWSCEVASSESWPHETHERVCRRWQLCSSGKLPVPMKPKRGRRETAPVVIVGHHICNGRSKVHGAPCRCRPRDEAASRTCGFEHICRMARDRRIPINVRRDFNALRRNKQVKQ